MLQDLQELHPLLEYLPATQATQVLELVAAELELARPALQAMQLVAPVLPE